ncbi:MAG: siderophore-interacting protein [Actinomycetota bacterium]|nr:siderophore-interacting protein [Actinomycetota bacterium]
MRVPTYVVPVRRGVAVSARMRRITLGGTELAGFVSTGLADERVKLLLPRPGQDRPVLPTVDEWGFHYPSGAVQPLSRTMTVRRFDPVALELDIDVALHDHGGAAAWALHTQKGDYVGIVGPTGGYRPAPEADCHVIAGDEAALPAICTIVERLPAGVHAHVFVEVENDADELTIESAADVQAVWLHRRGRVPSADGPLVRAVTGLAWPPGRVDVWAAGEALTMRALRRYLRDELRLDRDRFRVTGYWRHRLTEDKARATHLAAQDAARAAGASDNEVEDAGIY